MKDCYFLICLLIAFFTDASSSLYLSQEKVLKAIGDHFVVICKDNGGQPVSWEGPKGPLGLKTRPRVQTLSYGTVILFNSTSMDDEGTYTCKSPTESKQFHLKVAEFTNPTTDLHNKYHNNKYSNNLHDNSNNFGGRKSKHRQNPYRQGNNYYYHRQNNVPSFDDGSNAKEADDDGEDDVSDDDNPNLDGRAPLKFMDTPTEQRGMEGQNVVLRCEVTGGQATWVIDDIPKNKYRIVGDGLVLTNLSRHDTGTYVCKAFQENTGIVNDRKIHLIVEHKPTFPHPVYAKHEQAWGYIDGYVNLTCHVEAEPPPKFEWRKLNDRHKGVQRIIAVSPHVSVLQIKVDRHSFGDYKCTASNRLGELEKIFSLERGTKPMPPYLVELKGANADILDLAIEGPEPTEKELEEHMEPQWYSVAYKKANVDEWWQEQEFNMTEENSYALAGLDPNTDYEVRVAAKNLAGLSDYTNVTVYTTLPSSADGIFLPFSTNVLRFLFLFTILALIH